MRLPPNIALRPLFLFAWLLLAAAFARAQPLAPIEAAYAAPGPYRVAQQTVRDAAGRPQYELYLPQPLGAAHPAVTWGNGTGSLPRDYDALLEHLASWGFVTIDVYRRNVGSGAAILGAAQFLAAQSADPASPLFGRVDPGRIGAAGHSQGASGVINAATRFAEGTLIRTVVPVALPFQTFTDPEDRYDTRLLTVPMFLIGGTDDLLISPPSVNRSAYNRTDDTLPAAMAMLRNAGHTEIMGNGGGQRGYLTAWMRFQLAGDAAAAAAFGGAGAELLGNARWKSAQTQNLP